MNEDRSRGTVVPEEVMSLLDQRGRVEDWIEKLGDFREEASREVYERVREDYEGRLADLNERLAGHRTALQSSLDDHREKVSELERRRDEQAAELEEAKLRHAVGEFPDEEWERRRESGNAALEELDGTLEGERGALRELQDALSSLPGGAGAAPRPEAAPAVAEPAEAAEPVEGAAEPGEPEAEATAPGEPSNGRPTEEEPADEQAEEEAYEDAREDEQFQDELEFLESLSLEESDRFDAVSAMLDEEEEEGPGAGKEA